MTSRNTNPGILKSGTLGRDVKYSKLYKKLKRGRVVPEIFRDNKHPFELSVNRLTPEPNQPPPDNCPHLADDRVIALRSERQAKNQTFYCWAQLSVEDASRSGRVVQATPMQGNESHADICLPDEARKDESVLEEHVLELAFYAKWRPHPTKEHIFADKHPIEF